MILNLVNLAIQTNHHTCVTTRHNQLLHDQGIAEYLITLTLQDCVNNLTLNKRVESVSS